jgi:hypothetical protein
MRTSLPPFAYLDKLEPLIDIEHVLAAEERQRQAMLFEPLNRRPTIITLRDDWRHIQHQQPPDWPAIPYRDVFRAPAKMLVAELQRVYEGLLLRDDRAYTIRANYGLVIGPSLFGCEFDQVNDEMPWAHPLPDREAVVAMLDRGLPDLQLGLGARVWETEQLWMEWLAPYPNLRQTVRIGAPDAQGPFSLANHIVGNELFTWVVDDPELVHAVLDLMTRTYITIIRHHKTLVGEPDGVGYSFSYRLAGGARISDDSAVLVSGRMYKRFAVPYNAQLAEALHGLMVHFCGQGDQIFDPLTATPGITSVNFGNPEMQDFAARYQLAQERRVALLWDGPIPPECEHITTGLIHKRIVSTWDEALAAAGQR